jgi:cytidylate kinase
MAPSRLIIVSGFTAAGKTTHARLLAISLGWRYVGMSKIRRSCVPGSATAEEEWTPRGDEMRAESAALDLEMDRRLEEYVDRIDEPAVVDAWLQPWLCEAPGATRVWLGSDLPSRIRKAQVSRIRAGLPSSPSMSMTIAKKDAFSVEHFRRIYDIDFGPDPGVFDLSLDNSSYIAEATVHASDDGINRFAPVFNSRIGAVVEAKSYDG